MQIAGFGIDSEMMPSAGQVVGYSSESAIVAIVSLRCVQRSSADFALSNWNSDLGRGEGWWIVVDIFDLYVDLERNSTTLETSTGG